MKHREKYRASKQPDAQLELVERPPRASRRGPGLTAESMAAAMRDFSTKGKGKRSYQRQQRTWRRRE